jgi:ClpP class serine protease
LKSRARFSPVGVAAIEPKAYGIFWDAREPAPPEVKPGNVAIVRVFGPLMSHADWCFDSYDAIKARVTAAIDLKPSAIVLSLDSPGGLVSGCFDAANDIRRACDAAGVKLYAHCTGQTCSAAYALASVADAIVTPSSAEVGSIGCVAEIVSYAAADKAYGVDRRIISSGKRKSDGNPSLPITDEAEAALTARVMRLADLFFAHVAEHRGIDVDDVRALEAGIFVGEDAVSNGLADEVMSLDELVAAIAAGEFAADDADATEGKTMTTKNSAKASAESNDETPASKAKTAYRASLQAIVDDKDADQSSKDEATAALAVMDGDEPEAEADAPTTDDKPAKEDDKDKDAKAIASKALEIASSTAKSIADQKAADIETERASLLASRPDLSDAERKLLAKSPIADVRAYVKDQPKRKAKLGAVGVTVPVTRGEGQGEETEAASGDPSLATRIARAMGVSHEIVQPKFDGRRQTFPAMNRAERAAYLAKREAAKAEAIKKSLSAA